MARFDGRAAALVDAIDTRYDVGHERLLDAVVGVLLVTGVVLLALNGPFSAIRDLRIVRFVHFTLPIILAVVCYVRVAPSGSPIEIGALAIWAYYTLRGTGVAGYFLFGGQTAAYPGEMPELRNDVTLFLLLAVACAGLYAMAATQQERPLLKWALVAALPVGQLVAFAVYALV